MFPTTHHQKEQNPTAWIPQQQRRRRGPQDLGSQTSGGRVPLLPRHEPAAPSADAAFKLSPARIQGTHEGMDRPARGRYQERQDRAVERKETIPAAMLSEAELIERHRHGDATAFEEIHARFSGILFKVSRSYDLNEYEQDDVAQEVYLRVWITLADFRQESSLATWIYSCGKHKAVDIALTLQKCLLFLFGQEEGGLEPTSHDCATILHIEADSEYLEILMLRVPADFRTSARLAERGEVEQRGLPMVAKQSKTHYVQGKKYLFEFLHYGHPVGRRKLAPQRTASYADEFTDPQLGLSRISVE
ncbi:MAG: sigma factor [Corynebacterium sp.]|nr:sigma factor [Corynebacterium sp.]